MELTDAQKATLNELGLYVVEYRVPYTGDWFLNNYAVVMKSAGHHATPFHVVRPALAARVKELENTIRCADEVCEQFETKIAALESELAPIRQLKVGSAEWACYQMAMGKTVMSKRDLKWNVDNWRKSFEPYTLHTEPPPAPTADDLCAAIEAYCSAEECQGSAKRYNELVKLAAAYRAANAKGGA